MNEDDEETERPPASRRGRRPSKETLFDVAAAVDYCLPLQVDQVIILQVPEQDDPSYVVRRLAAGFSNKARNISPKPSFSCKSASAGPSRILVWRTA